ncbi:FtsQ-type POTRA domain-containing protein [Microbacterium sp. P07]|uniref:FtsQ-type POTRA domain-containing protein n=1 Tax=Microbacterium sp. P07 TaxID=3366952 RepID=UPI003746624E
MRRPPPLPPPPEPRTPAEPPPPSIDPSLINPMLLDPSRSDPSSPGDRESDTGAVLPFAPMQRRPAPIDPSLLTPPIETTDAADLGLRDVWRASRARRRALRAEVRRFTVRQRRRRMVWLGVLGALVLLVAGTVAAAYSPLFAVQRIEVIGTTTLDPNAVADALADQLGTPLPLIDDSEVKAALVTFPLVESYSLEARPPNDLVVRIVERLPVGVLQSPAGFTVVDAAGVALSTSAEAPAGLPVFDIRGGVDSDAFRAAGQVMRSLPDSIRSQVTAVTASTPDDVAFTLGGTNTQVVWGSAEQSALKAVVLEKQMIGRPADGVRLYDVSTPAAVVVS